MSTNPATCDISHVMAFNKLCYCPMVLIPDDPDPCTRNKMYLMSATPRAKVFDQAGLSSSLETPQVLERRKDEKSGREDALGACDQTEDSSDQSPAHTDACFAYGGLV